MVPQIFERWSNNRIIEGNMQGGLILAPYVSSNLNSITLTVKDLSVGIPKSDLLNVTVILM